MQLYTRLVTSVLRSVYGEPPDVAGREGYGLVLVADGVGGVGFCGTALRYVAGAQRLPVAVEVVPWGHGWGRWHADLTRADNRDAQARRVAAAVERFRGEAPGAPVYLLGKSGGTGVVVKALEGLPEG